MNLVLITEQEVKEIFLTATCEMIGMQRHNSMLIEVWNVKIKTTVQCPNGRDHPLCVMANYILPPLKFGTGETSATTTNIFHQ